MNQGNIDRLEKLNNLEAKDFLLLCVGLDCFLKSKTMKIIKKQLFEAKFESLSWLKKEFKNISLRLEIDNSSEKDGYKTKYLLYKTTEKRFLYLEDGDQTEKEFRRIEEIDFNLPPNVIDLLIDAVRNDITGDETNYKKVDELLNLKKPSQFFYRFVLGAGVNSEYGMSSWKQLESDFKKVVNDHFGSPNLCEAINDEAFNTNYGIFEIVKDIFYPEYVRLLEQMIINAHKPSAYDDTTLGAVAAVLNAQVWRLDAQTVLTFNYDDLLECSLKCRSEMEGDSIIFKHNRDLLDSGCFNIAIVHSHGYLPKIHPFPKECLDSVVLTTEEYFENYEKPSSFGYYALNLQLNKTCCFVGNSLTDYEEQKVIDSHFKRNPSQFHYWYGCLEDKDIRTVMYKTVFLLKIGVIPLWYHSFDDIKQEFFDYARGLEDEEE